MPRTATVQRFRLEGGRAGTNCEGVATSTGDTLKASVLALCKRP